MALQDVKGYVGVMYEPRPGSEGRWTEPRVDCPHPERWHADDAESTELEVTELVSAFVRALRPDYCIETGTAWGQTAAHVGLVLRHAGNGRLDTLEPDPERWAYATARCAGLPVTVHRAESLTFHPSSPVDFAWFDSLCELRVPEFRAYHPWMHTSTVVGFHDTGPHKPMREHIDQLAAEGLIAPIYLPTPRGVCFARVVGLYTAVG
jgi:hypothetical protein